MNKVQGSYLLVAVLTFLVVIAMFFFAVTDNKNTLGLLTVAIFFALIDVFWVYRFVKGSRKKE